MKKKELIKKAANIIIKRKLTCLITIRKKLDATGFASGI